VPVQLRVRCNGIRRHPVAQRREHAYAHSHHKPPSSAACSVALAFVSPAQASASAANTYDTASRPSVAGDDPVNNSDPSGLHVCNGNPLTWGGCVGNVAQGVAGGVGADYSKAVQADQWAGKQIATALCNNGASNGAFAGVLDCAALTQGTSCPGSAAAGTVVWNTDGLPELQILHEAETIQRDPGYGYWSQQSTESIVRSLEPGAEEPLLVKPNGVVANGNTRISILQERGYDVDGLPRVVLPEPDLGIGDGDLFGE
jgi:hypothetical protein